MKVVILAGGFGTRLTEETSIRPKPMVEIGERPILWHIMKMYSHYGFNDFVILLGYKGYYIKEYFANYFLHQSDVCIDLANNQMEVLNNSSEKWKVTLLDTGLHSMTGARIKRAQKYLTDTFMLTYGDGVANINLEELLKFHRSHGQLLTMTSVQPEGRFGALQIDSETQRVASFKEKPQGDGAWINGGFFVCEPGIFDYIGQGPDVVFEQAPLERLAADNQLYTYRHTGFWKCMDTIRDKVMLNEMWETNKAKWKLWQ